MYNVKVLKYPSGWQYRIYSDIVGRNSHDKDLEYFNASQIESYNENLGYFEHYPADPSKCWRNIFSGNIERIPDIYIPEDLEKKKKHSEYVSRARSLSRVYHLARSNVWEWFFTLTFNPKKVDSFDYDVTKKKLSRWLENMRRISPEMRYLLVPELHKSGRIHFHGLFANCDSLGFINSGHTTKDGQVIYNVGSYKLGWSTATKIKDNSRCTKYISKYITKELCADTFGKKRYWYSRNLNDVQPVEHILSFESLQQLEKSISENCLFKKVLESGNLKVTYIETEVLENG